MSSYEPHDYKDPDFPIIFHQDKLPDDQEDIPIHWHENIELLYFVEGSAALMIDNTRLTAKKGDIVVINPESLHAIFSDGSRAVYYCLILHKTLYQQLSFLYDDEKFHSLIEDTRMNLYFDSIIDEMGSRRGYYKEAVRQLIALLMISLHRSYQVTEQTSINADISMKKTELVKASLRFIREHYRDPLSVSDICNHLGFSKYYFCHVFKEVTGTTVIEYLNRLRCVHAKNLLVSGKYTVYQAAELSGFHTLSYFSKTYRKVFGKVPSEEK